jgi:transposase
MSLQPETIPAIPEETARVARTIVPQGNRYLLLRDELGTIYTDDLFLTLYPQGGSYAQAPWRLALVCVMQYMENYTDRQAAEAVRMRIDWKYVLSLDLTDPGFDFSVLSEFRQRLLVGGQEEVVLNTLLQVCRERGWLKERGKQRTDATHVLAAIRTMNRLECVGETLRAALKSLAVVVPDWLRAHVPVEWYERYGDRIEDFRMPKEASKRQVLAEQIGTDGFGLLAATGAQDAPIWLREIPAVEMLRRVWVQQFLLTQDKLSWRSDDNIPPASVLISSPYDPDAHMSIKRSTVWTGYKVHITETCEEQAPQLLIHVETTAATTQDIEETEPIHQALAQKHLLPSVHALDAGYVDGPHLVESSNRYGIEILGPVALDRTWQGRAGQGFSMSDFAIDWEAHRVTCPQGNTSRKWKWASNAHGGGRIHVEFGKKDCLACPCRTQCTTAESNPRQISFHPQVQHEAIQSARKRQTSQEFQDR